MGGNPGNGPGIIAGREEAMTIRPSYAVGSFSMSMGVVVMVKLVLPGFAPDRLYRILPSVRERAYTSLPAVVGFTAVMVPMKWRG